MALQYNWRANTTFKSDTSMSHGVTPSIDTSWKSADIGTAKTGTYIFWYRDSNTAYQGSYQDALSSRVAIKVTQTWNTSVDEHNNLTVTVTTTVNSIDRDNIRHPSGIYDSNTPGRNIKLYKKQGGSVVWSATDNKVAEAHNISGTINVGTETFTLAPGNTANVRPSLYLHNQTVGMSSYDDIWLGVQFRNPLPPDYRPGQTYNNGTWYSHDRTGGWAGVWDGSTFKEMRTDNGPTGTTNPPYIMHNDGWHNQRKIGQS